MCIVKLPNDSYKLKCLCDKKNNSTTALLLIMMALVTNSTPIYLEILHTYYCMLSSHKTVGTSRRLIYLSEFALKEMHHYNVWNFINSIFF